MSGTNTKLALKGMSSQTVVTLLIGVVEILAFSILSRLLTQQDFGYYAAIMAITTVFDSFSETGIGAAIIQKKEADKNFVNNAFSLSVIIGIGLMSIMFLAARPISMIIADDGLTLPLMLMSITLFSHSMTSIPSSIMMRRMEFLKVGLLKLISLILATVVAIVAASMGYGFYAIMAKTILSTVVYLVLAFSFARTMFSFQIERKVIKTIFNFSGWLMISVFFRNLAHQIDKLLMSRLLSVQALGEYNRPKEFIVQITSKIGGIYDTALFPVLSKMQDDIDGLTNAYHKSMRALNLASIIMALFFFFNGELIIRIFFGEKWFNILEVLQILSFTIVFYFEARLADCYLRSLGLTKQQFYFRILEVILKVIGLVTAFKWGIVGIAISIVITDMVSVALKHYYLCCRLGISLTDNVKTVLISWRGAIFIAPAMFACDYLLSESLLFDMIKATVFCLVCGVMILFAPSFLGLSFAQNIIEQIKNKLLVKR